MFLYSIIEFIVELFKSKDPKDTAYNDSANLLIFLLAYFCIFIAFLWVCSKFGLFG